ncbi:MAG: preprotein translocase subunit YajC [Lentimicrobiaceae bacterium]|jgi:preprotein translocase subunit YajC|nr:preprotein translocase subunit YajC [Lentimicrobiaceae bacterium]
MNFLSILLLANPNQAPGTEGGGNMLTSLMPLILLLIIFYFFFIRPQMKRAKEQRKFREELKKGDKVVTIGGIHGKIEEVKEGTVVLQIDNNVKITVEKSAIVTDRTQVAQQR